MSNWYAQKLQQLSGNGRPPAPQPQQFQIPVPAVPAPPPAPQQQQPQAPQGPPSHITTPEQVTAWAKHWQGGEAMRKEGSWECPQCQSVTGFTQYGGKGSITNTNGTRSSPAARCFECGYNGMYDQADASNWAV